MALRMILSWLALDSGLLVFLFSGFLLVFGGFLLFLDGSNPPSLVFPVPFCLMFDTRMGGVGLSLVR